MRKLCPLAVALVVGWSVTASAAGPYGEDDGTYDEEAPFFQDTTPEPPPPPARPTPPESPYSLLPSETPQQAYPAPQQDPGHQHWQYNGPHAINAQYGSGWCNVQGAHYHPYPPFDDRLFQENRGGYDFLGDPADFGYTGGSLYWYSAAHPIATGWGIGWCYIPYAHRHLYAPVGSYYSMCGPYWCWGGPFDAWYWYYRPYYFGFYSAWYPRYYRGGIYHRTGVAASPGRFGRHGHSAVGTPGRGRPAGTLGRPAGRPGGYAHPVPPAGYRRPSTTLYHRLPANSMRARPTYGAPARQLYGARPAPGPRFGAPSHSYSAPRSYGAPRSYSAPRSFGAPRSYSAPTHSRPSMSAPRSMGGFRGGRR